MLGQQVHRDFSKIGVDAVKLDQVSYCSEHLGVEGLYSICFDTEATNVRT